MADESKSDLTKDVEYGRIEGCCNTSLKLLDYEVLRRIVLQQNDPLAGLRDRLVRAFRKAGTYSKERTVILNIVRIIETRRFNIDKRDAKLINGLLRR